MPEIYPVVLYNPQRPNAGFTWQSGDLYLTVDGNYIAFAPLLEYIETATGTPSASDVTKAQNALNGLYSSLGSVRTDGVLDSNTAARVAEFQLANGMLPTGVPTSDTLAKLTGPTTQTNSTTQTNAGAQPKPKPDYGPMLGALVVVLFFVLIEE
jgi:peptidoglycan hydrolase-like protein with peptidoglycan-binding domain